MRLPRSPAHVATRVAAEIVAVASIAAVACSSSSGTSSGSSAANVPTTATAGFDVATNAFAFPNFADGYASSFLTPDLVARMFGKAAVCIDAAIPCTLTPAANLWANNVNASMGTGRCEGFAVLSGVFFLGLSSASQFGAASTRDLTLDGNVALQAEIAYWYATQNVTAVTQATHALYAKDAIAFLASFLQPGTTDYFRIGFVRRTKHGFAGGHAVLPTGYEEVAGQPGVYNLHVYDNNDPDQDRVMSLDTNANRWEYKGSSDPTQASADYVGDPGNANPLYFAPIRLREGTLACPFCSGSSTTQTIGSGSATVRASDANGDSAGIDADGAPTTSGVASVEPSFSELDTWDASGTTTLTLPVGDTTLAIAGNDATTVSQVTQLGAGYAVQAANLSIPSGATDTLTLSGNGAHASYANTSGTALTLGTTLVRAKGGTVQLQVFAPAHATTVAVGVDDVTGALTAKADGTSGQMITVAVTKTAADGTTQSGTIVVTGSATSTVTVQADSWMPGDALTGSQDTGSGTTTTVGDACADGVKDGTESDVDCGGSCATACATGKACSVSTDCVTGTCDASTKLCALPPCSDGVKDGAETGIDCGGGTCAACGLGNACVEASDCTTNVCTKNVCVDVAKRVFLSSGSRSGSFGGLAGADAICQAEAAAAPLTGTYKAFLSNSTISASTRLTHSTGAYVLVDGTEVAASGATFFSTAHEAAIQLQANGVMGFADVWTGSHDNGDADGSGKCDDWSNSAIQDAFTLGESNIQTSSWGDTNPQESQSCGQTNNFYCIEQ